MKVKVDSWRMCLRNNVCARVREGEVNGRKARELCKQSRVAGIRRPGAAWHAAGRRGRGGSWRRVQREGKDALSRPCTCGRAPFPCAAGWPRSPRPSPPGSSCPPAAAAWGCSHCWLPAAATAAAAAGRPRPGERPPPPQATCRPPPAGAGGGGAQQQPQLSGARSNREEPPPQWLQRLQRLLAAGRA